MIFLILLFTLAISVWNSYAVGRMWPDAKFQGGFGKLLALSGAVMTGIGFSMILIVILTFIGGATHLLSHQTIVAIQHVYPALIIVPLVLSGFIITLESWKAVFAKGQSGWSRMGNLAGAGWNTYAEASNIMSMPGIFKKAFNNDDDGEATAGALMVAIVALLGGFVIAFALINYFAKREVQQRMASVQ